MWPLLVLLANLGTEPRRAEGVTGERRRGRFRNAALILKPLPERALSFRFGVIQEHVLRCKACSWKGTVLPRLAPCRGALRLPASPGFAP